MQQIMPDGFVANTDTALLGVRAVLGQ